MGAGETGWGSPCRSCSRHTCVCESRQQARPGSARTPPPSILLPSLLGCRSPEQPPGTPQSSGPGTEDQLSVLAGKDSSSSSKWLCTGCLEGCCLSESQTGPVGPVQREGESSVLSHFPPARGYGLHGSEEDSWNGHPATLQQSKQNKEKGGMRSEGLFMR